MSLFKQPSQIYSRVALALIVWGIRADLIAQQTDPELIELRTTVEAASKQNAQLEHKIEQLNEKAEALNSNLVSLSTKLGMALQSNSKLQELVDGQGIGASFGDEESLRQKLLLALRDLKSMVSENEVLRKALENRPSSPEVLTKLSDSGANASDLNSHPSQIVAVKPELGLAIWAAGSRMGVQTGTPVIVTREGKTVAKGLVSEVRAEYSGLVLNAVEGMNSVKTGDSVQKFVSKNY